MQGGMRSYQQAQGAQDKALTYREMYPGSTPVWEVHGHSLASEEGKPATEWDNVELYYEGDNEDAAMLAVWNHIANHAEPWVIFVSHFGDVYKRLDIC